MIQDYFYAALGAIGIIIGGFLLVGIVELLILLFLSFTSLGRWILRAIANLGANPKGW